MITMTPIDETLVQDKNNYEIPVTEMKSRSSGGLRIGTRVSLDRNRPSDRDVGHVTETLAIWRLVIASGL